MPNKKYYHDYPTEKIGGGNPYYRCSFCKISDPQINGTLEGHADNCEYRIAKEKSMEKKYSIEQIREYFEGWLIADRYNMAAKVAIHNALISLECDQDGIEPTLKRNEIK